MLHIVCTTDPISGKDLSQQYGMPYIVDEGNETSLLVYFESEHNRQTYLDVPVERPATEHTLNLSNPEDLWYDEG